MVEHELPLKPSFSDEGFETVARQLGLIVKRMSLAKYPSSVHWHLSRPGHKGVLEATWIPGRRLWLSVHENRRADWQDEAIRQIMEAWS
jgi:hypothetical protein